MKKINAEMGIRIVGVPLICLLCFVSGGAYMDYYNAGNLLKGLIIGLIGYFYSVFYFYYVFVHKTGGK